MMGLSRDEKGELAAIRRLSSLVVLDQESVAALARATNVQKNLPARGELLRDGKPIKTPLMILSGWAARVRQLEDGRRQIMSFLLPGDLIGNCRHIHPVAVSTVVSLTPLRYCAAPQLSASQALQEAFSISSALDEAYLLAQITRLGRLNAEERIVDLFLELHERLTLCGLAHHGRIQYPLTQEMLADATGLTQVHVNRTLQALRRRGDIALSAGSLTIVDPDALAERVGHTPTRVTAAELPLIPPQP